MKSSQRSRLRRFRKNLEKEGTVGVEVYSANSFEFPDAIQEAFRIESSGWKAAERTSVLTNSVLNNFFKAYISTALQKGILRLFMLKINEKNIAMILGVVYAQRFWILKIGYDESWSEFAPGIILHHESIKWAFENNMKAYEFLGTVEPWIDTWTKSKHTYYTYRLFPKSFSGLICLGIEAAKILKTKIQSSVKQIIS
jgi:CelD/BcsL family acetyltransferase involved in cellulose biosynthesis